MSGVKIDKLSKRVALVSNKDASLAEGLIFATAPEYKIHSCLSRYHIYRQLTFEIRGRPSFTSPRFNLDQFFMIFVMFFCFFFHRWMQP